MSIILMMHLLLLLLTIKYKLMTNIHGYANNLTSYIYDFEDIVEIVEDIEPILSILKNS